MERSTFVGALWEGFVAAEIIKAQLNRGGRRELYYFRDEQGLEVDFLVPAAGGRLRLVEAKAGRTVTPGMAAPMQSLGRALGDKLRDAWLVHRPSGSAPRLRALSPGVQAVDVDSLIAELAR